MKHLIILATFLMITNVFSEEIYLSCTCFDKKAQVDSVYYSGDCQSEDPQKMSVTLDKEKKYLSMPLDYLRPAWDLEREKYEETKNFYTRRSYCSDEVDGISFCEITRYLDRVSLVLTDFSNWDEKYKGSLSEVGNKRFIKYQYQCSIVEKL